MDRRAFLLGLLTASGSTAVPGAALAHSRRRSSLDCGVHLLASARLAIRKSRRHIRGLSIEVASTPISSWRKSSHHSHHGPFTVLAHSLELKLSSSPFRRLERNLKRFEERFEKLMDRREARHFHDHWHDGHWTAFDTREHLESCSACRRSFRMLIRDTDLDLIPVIFEEAVTVIAPFAGPEPVRPLHLPKVPDGMRSALKGKTLILQADVNRHGRAEVFGTYGRGFTDFVVQRAVDLVEKQAWHPARGADGRPCSEDVRIRFQW